LRPFSKYYPGLLLCCLSGSFARTMAQAPPATTEPNASNTAASTASPVLLNEPPSVSKAMHLYRDRKYDDAVTEYKRVIQAGFNAPAGYAGLARVELKQNKVADAAAAAQKGIDLGPHLAATHIALGEVYFRQGKIEEAADEFRKLVVANTSDAQAYYGMAKVMHASSYHKKEKLLIDRAHQLNPDDPDIRQAWMASLSLTERIKELQAVLDAGTLESAVRADSEKHLARLKEIARQPERGCRLPTAVKSTQTDLLPIMHDARISNGYGLPVKVNGTPSTLLLDTGAGGILISKRIADKAGVHKIIDNKVGGIGDAGEQAGYLGYASSIRIGDLEFQDCYVQVMEKRFSDSEDGLLGADVFSDFLVDLDFPNHQVRLSQLPEDPSQPATPAALDSQAELIRQPHDKYIAPEMKSFSPVYRLGHDLLLPTKVNDKGPVLFLIDTGSFANMIALDLARVVGKVAETDTAKVKGISGDVKKVYRAQDVVLQFSGYRQRMNTMLSLDMSNISIGAHTEVSGIYGFEMLHMLEIKIDYRDGLVAFTFDSNRYH
jgi:tetratricopeptide (TPR) repeat protein